MSTHNLREKLHAKNFKKFGFDLNLFVSICSALVVLTFMFFTLTSPQQATQIFDSITISINNNFSWLYVLAMNIAFIFMIIIGLSKYGKIRLGGFKARPEFNNFSWYSMLFSAGVGIGIFFYGVAEPIYNKTLPNALQAGSKFDNFKILYMHWGAHAWAMYCLVAVGLGYFAYNKSLPFSFRSLFYPVLKDKIFGIWGDIIDTIAVVSVLFGLATSLGLGARQLNAGLNYILGIPFSTRVQSILIFSITCLAIISVVSGISKGVKILSQANSIMAVTLLILILLIGPFSYILSTYLSSMGLYISEFFNNSFFVATQAEGIAWQSAWTIFYWAWWISWTPFVGAFIARISKGRTIREIALGAVVIPTIIVTFSMTILGASGIYLDELNGGVITVAIEKDMSTALFEMFRYLTTSQFLINLLSVVALICIMLFFITSSDSGSLVVDNLTSGGQYDSPKVQRVFWASLEGLIALTVLVLGGEGALNALQSVVLISALPFSILFLIMTFSLLKEFKYSYEKYEYNSTVKLKGKIESLDENAEYK